MAERSHGALVALLVLVGLATSAAAQGGIGVHVTGVSGPTSRRALRAALPARAFEACQLVPYGRTVRVTGHTTVEGALVIDAVQAHEEIRAAAPCVRQVVESARVPASGAETTFRLAVVFPALLFGAPGSTSLGHR